MSFDFTTLITDRTRADVDRVKAIADKIRAGTVTDEELSEWHSAAMKGAYNYTDLNRVTAAMDALKARLEGYGYAVPGYQRIKIDHPQQKPTSRLPEGYTELAWIESTGTQCTDTGFKPNQDTRVVLDVEITAENESLAANVIFGCRTSTSSKAYAVQWNTSNNYFQHFYNNGYDNLSFGDFNRQIVEMNKNVLSLDGVTHERSYTSFQCDYTMYLLALNNAGTSTFFSKMRVYSCQIYDNGTLVRDYIPCINPSGDIGLYDLVTASFFGNAGTGVFIAGTPVVKLPEGYTQVEYIESSGSQYIDSGLAGNQNTRIDVDYSTTATAGALIGADSSWGLNMCTIEVHFAAFATSNYMHTTVPSGRHGVSLNKGVFSLDGKTLATMSGNFTTPVNLTFFALNRNGAIQEYGKLKLYYCSIYNNSTLVRFYIPCINESGESGLYDIVDGKFYGNAGTGTFAVGDVVESAITVNLSEETELDPYLWYETDAPTTEQMTVYLLNVSVIRSVLAVLSTTPKVPADMVDFMVGEANDIELILLDVYRQINIMVTTFVPAGEALSGGDNL